MLAVPTLVTLLVAGRGSALDLAFRQEGFEDVYPDFDDEAEAKAPPTGAPVIREAQKVDANPFVDAQALRAEACARPSRVDASWGPISPSRVGRHRPRGRGTHPGQ